MEPPKNSHPWEFFSRAKFDWGPRSPQSHVAPRTYALLQSARTPSGRAREALKRVFQSFPNEEPLLPTSFGTCCLRGASVLAGRLGGGELPSQKAVFFGTVLDKIAPEPDFLRDCAMR